MAVLGRALVFLALAVAIYGIVAALIGARRGRRDLVESARRSVYACAGLLTGAFLVLELAFLRSDFSFAVVTSHSSTTTPLFYKGAAAWSSQEGSLLLWVWLLSLWSSLVLFLTRKRLRDVVPYATAVLLGMVVFFATLLAFFESPFTQLAMVPAEGQGLNPLLRHPSMMIHPPMLYSGYTLFAIPFAFAVGRSSCGASTRSGSRPRGASRSAPGCSWDRDPARRALVVRRAGLGRLLGLGPGRERVAAAVADRHRVHPLDHAPGEAGHAEGLERLADPGDRHAVRARHVPRAQRDPGLDPRVRGLDARHPVPRPDRDDDHRSVVLVVSRRESLRSEHQLDSLLSREAVFIANNLVLVGLAFVVFWGTFFPLIAEALTGDRKTVGPPWFDRYTVPLTLALVLLSGVGPVIAWRRATWANARRNFAVPVAAALVTLVACLATGLGDRITAVIMFCAAAFVFGTVGQELWRGTGARKAMSGEPLPLALVSLVTRNRRRYGGYFVHIGIALLFVGVAASSAFENARDVRMRPGQTEQVGDYKVTYERSTAGIAEEQGASRPVRIGAVLKVQRGDSEPFTAITERRYYPSQDPKLGPVGRYFEVRRRARSRCRPERCATSGRPYQPDQEGIRTVVDALDRRVADKPVEQQLNATGRLIAFLRDSPPPGTFRMISSPLVTWIWVGAIVTFLGGLLALWPAPDAHRRRANARAAGPRRARTCGEPERPRRLLAMEALAPLLVIVALALVVWVVAAPLRKGPQAVEQEAELERVGLEAARDAKYREIRELELDHRTGKLSDQDFRELDRQLRAEAVQILRELDARE
jgi:cytochrome c-type biogenesis protein CcmF